MAEQVELLTASSQHVRDAERFLLLLLLAPLRLAHRLHMGYPVLKALRLLLVFLPNHFHFLRVLLMHMIDQFSRIFQLFPPDPVFFPFLEGNFLLLFVLLKIGPLVSSVGSGAAKCSRALESAVCFERSGGVALAVRGESGGLGRGREDTAFVEYFFKR